MSQQERKDRIHYLWKRLRIVVTHRGLLHRLIAETQERERDRFGLDPAISQKLSQEEEEERMLIIDNEE